MRLALASLVAIVLLSGCGGGGGSSAPSPYAGAWSGVAGFATGGGTGTGAGDLTNLLVTVDNGGRIVGTWGDSGGSGPVGGTVTRGGTLTLSLNDPGSPDTATVARGTSALSGTGWQGSLTVTSEDLLGSSMVVELTRQ